jgi:hypothetical protein
MKFLKSGHESVISGSLLFFYHKNINFSIDKMKKNFEPGSIQR